MVGSLTFHWADDVGAMLQAFALKHCLEDLGEQTEVIPYAPLRLSGRYWWCPLAAKALPDGRVKYRLDLSAWRYNRALGSTFWKRRRAMRAFRRRYLSARPAIRTASRISLKKYDLVFVGSDQVWNPDITVGLDDAYIGNIKNRDACRLVAYAASMGRDTLPEDCREKFIRCAGPAFSAISVREESALPFLERLLHRPAAALIDPVFLLRREDWRRIGHLPPEKGYVLLHRTEGNADMAQYAIDLARQLDRQLIQTSFPMINGPDRAVRLCAEGGPAEFLGYIQNAACIVTNSFHAAAFSILFEKPFIAFGHSAYHSRLAGLAEKLGLQARIWDQARPAGLECVWEAIDWPAVQAKIAAERAQSIQFICDALKEAKNRN